MSTNYYFNLDNYIEQNKKIYGNIVHITSQEVKGLSRASFVYLELKSQSSLSPLWHTNANKIGYCNSGKFLITIRSPEKKDTFYLEKGDVFFVPMGFIHQITNVGSEAGTILFSFDCDLPKTMELTKSVYSLNTSVFDNVFYSKGKPILDHLKSAKTMENITFVNDIPQNGSNASSYKFSLESSPKIIEYKSGYLQEAVKNDFSILEGLSILRFSVEPGCAVEPHWHPNASELIFVLEGHSKISMLEPEGDVTEFEVRKNQGAFVPASNFHNIENIGSVPLEVIAFFNHENPNYIGLGETASSFSTQLLSSYFNVDPQAFTNIHFTEKPLVIVPADLN